MTKQTVDLFTIGLVVGENGEMEANNKEELVQYLADSKFIRPLSYYFLIATPTVKEKTKGGIILSEDTKDLALVGNNIGRVIGKGGAIGAGKGGCYEDCQDLEIGDYIGYNPHAGQPQNCRGHKVIVMADEAIKIAIPDPTQHTDGIFTAFSIKGVN